MEYQCNPYWHLRTHFDIWVITNSGQWERKDLIVSKTKSRRCCEESWQTHTVNTGFELLLLLPALGNFSAFCIKFIYYLWAFSLKILDQLIANNKWYKQCTGDLNKQEQNPFMNSQVFISLTHWEVLRILETFLRLKSFFCKHKLCVYLSRPYSVFKLFYLYFAFFATRIYQFMCVQANFHWKLTKWNNWRVCVTHRKTVETQKHSALHVSLIPNKTIYHCGHFSLHPDTK